MCIAPRTLEGLMLSSLLVAAMLATILIAAFPQLPSWGFMIAYAALTLGVTGLLTQEDEGHVPPGDGLPFRPDDRDGRREW